MNQTHLAVWSAIANWIVAVANVVLFATAFYSLRNDRRRLTKIEKAERQKCAENVYAWIEERSPQSIIIACRNGGTSAIYDVVVTLVDAVGNAAGSAYTIDVMKPLEEKSFSASSIPQAQGARLTINFRDPSGLRWSRLGDGLLVEDAPVLTPETLHRTTGNQAMADSRMPFESRRRSIVKTLLWRVVGILWTWIGAYLIILLVPPRLASAGLIATMIVVYHHSTRTFMYYIYERGWLMLKWGRTETAQTPMRKWEIMLWTTVTIIAVAVILYVLVVVSPIIEGKKP